jgi:hypothetical protein
MSGQSRPVGERARTRRGVSLLPAEPSQTTGASPGAAIRTPGSVGEWTRDYPVRMAVRPIPPPDSIQVTATALATGGRWLVSLVGASEINVQVRHLADVDAHMSDVLARDLGRERVDAHVHIRWYDASRSLPWPSWAFDDAAALLSRACAAADEVRPPES